MKKIIFIFFLNVLFPQLVFSQTGITDNYPLKIGNLFVFTDTQVGSFSPANNITYYKGKITKDTIIGSKKYFVITDYYKPYYSTFGQAYLRLDSTNGNLFMFDSVNSCPNYFGDILIDSLWASLNDSIIGCGVDNYICNDTSNYTIFGISRPGKSFMNTWYFGSATESTSRRYEKGFGFIHHKYSYSRNSPVTREVNLKGCKIDGIVYGDTTIPMGRLVIVGPETIPYKTFSLTKFLNLHNSNTVISYSIIRNHFVNLKLFDVYGKEVAVLVNENQQPGTYEFEINEANLPAGVYFYRIRISGDNNKKVFAKTKRLVLLK